MKIKKYLCILFIFFMMSSCGGSSTSGGNNDGGGDDNGGDDTTIPDVAAVSQDAGDFGALMVNKEGEMLLPMLDPPREKVTGVLWIDAAGTAVTVFLDPDTGLPTKAVLGDYVVLFSNWDIDAQTVDIAMVYTTTGYIEIFRGQSIDLTNYTDLYAGINVPGATKAFCFPACESDDENLAELLKIAALGVSVGACGVATTISLGAMAIPCAGVILTTALAVTGEETWLNNLEDAHSILTGVEVLSCLSGEVSECITSGLNIGGTILDGSSTDEPVEGVYDVVSDDSVTTAENDLAIPFPEGVVSGDAGDLPSCPDSYQCNPGAYMPCYPDGVKQCSADCVWGDCSGADDGGDTTTCGDGTCNGSETEGSCPDDCGGGASGCYDIFDCDVNQVCCSGECRADPYAGKGICSTLYTASCTLCSTDSDCSCNGMFCDVCEGDASLTECVNACE